MRRSPRRSKPATSAWAIDDEVTALRRKGSAGPTIFLPKARRGTLTMGSAIVRRARDGWWISSPRVDLKLRRDGVELPAFRLMPGVEIGLRSITLIAESPRLQELARTLGYLVGLDAWPAIDHALRVVRETVCARRMLALCGDTSEALIAAARRIHHLTVGRGEFAICTQTAITSNRFSSARAALAFAAGGTVCLVDPLPLDLSRMLDRWHASSPRAQLIRCARELRARERCMLDPIIVAPLKDRPRDRNAIFAHYVSEASQRLDAAHDLFMASEEIDLADHDTPDMLEVAATRIVAFRHFGGVTQAAAHLGITHAALLRYLARRGITSVDDPRIRIGHPRHRARSRTVPARRADRPARPLRKRAGT
jgi:hypothetical protein